MTSYLTGVIAVPANVIAHIIHTAFDCISIVPNYEYIVVFVVFVDKTYEDYHTAPSRLGIGVHVMLGAIIPVGMYELYAPGTPFACPAFFIDSPVIPPGTTEQEER